MRIIYGQLALAHTILMDDLNDADRPSNATNTASPQND